MKISLFILLSLLLLSCSKSDLSEGAFKTPGANIIIKRNVQDLGRAGGIDVYLDGAKIATVNTWGNGYAIVAYGKGLQVVSMNFQKGASQPDILWRLISVNGNNSLINYNDNGEVANRLPLTKDYKPVNPPTGTEKQLIPPQTAP